jgi:tetratricopeptide (TPR) repeat protein
MINERDDMINLYNNEQPTCSTDSSGFVSDEFEIRRIEQSFHKKFIIMIAVFGFVFVATVIHVINWDQYSLSIIPLKISNAVGMASPQSLRELARICEERMKYECTEEALQDALRAEPSVGDLIRLGNLQRKMNGFQSALVTYTSALENIKKEGLANTTELSDIYYGLAKSYESVGQNDQALANYDLAIKAKPEVIQITVTAAYLNLLKVVGKLDIAKAVIAEARKRSGSDSLFSGVL